MALTWVPVASRSNRAAGHGYEPVFHGVLMDVVELGFPEVSPDFAMGGFVEAVDVAGGFLVELGQKCGEAAGTIDSADRLPERHGMLNHLECGALHRFGFRACGVDWSGVGRPLTRALRIQSGAERRTPKFAVRKTGKIWCGAVHPFGALAPLPGL